MEERIIRKINMGMITALTWEEKQYLIFILGRIEECERYEKALMFYANEDNHLLVDGENTKVSIDSGRVARKALEDHQQYDQKEMK